MHCKSSFGNHDNRSTSHGNLMKLTKVTFDKKASKPTLALTVEILWYHARAYCWAGLGNILRDIDIVIEFWKCSHPCTGKWRNQLHMYSKSFQWDKIFRCNPFAFSKSGIQQWRYSSQNLKILHWNIFIVVYLPSINWTSVH